MIALHLSARKEPLAACAALCMSKESTRLVTRLLQFGDAELARLSGVHGEDFVIICGDPADLPWVNGVQYFGKDPTAPQLLLPTALGPNVSSALLERAVALRLATQPNTASGPFAVCFEPPQLIPVGAAQALRRTALEDWLTARSETETPP
jgi:MoxR-vWA-beta-propeller ternary system domain bpX5